MSWAVQWHFFTFLAKCRDVLPWKSGGEKGQSGEISDMLLVVQPVKKKLKQISAGCWNAGISSPGPSKPLNKLIEWMLTGGDQLKA